MVINKTPNIWTTILLCLSAIISTIVFYYVYKYFWPPIQRLPTSEIAENITINTNLGTMKFKLDGQSLFAKSQFTRLCRSGFYNGIRFHRVVPALLIETGDPLTKFNDQRQFWGQGGLNTAFKNEVSRFDKFTAGTLAFTGSKANTYGSLFFITTKDTKWLSGHHTILGHLSSGLDIVRSIESTTTSATGLPIQDIIIHDIECL